jgi:DNA-binding CsgD family transcriptional regulator
MDECTADWWADLNREVIECVAAGPTTPAEVGRRLGMSEAGATSLLTMLAREGKVRIALVEVASEATILTPAA